MNDARKAERKKNPATISKNNENLFPSAEMLPVSGNFVVV